MHRGLIALSMLSPISTYEQTGNCSTTVSQCSGECSLNCCIDTSLDDSPTPISSSLVLDTPSLILLNSSLLDNSLLLDIDEKDGALISLGSSGADRHLDIGLQVVEAHPWFPYFLEKRLAIPTSTFFIYK